MKNHWLQSKEKHQWSCSSPIAELNLSVGATNNLEKNSIYTLGDMLEIPKEQVAEMLTFPQMAELEEALGRVLDEL